MRLLNFNGSQNKFTGSIKKVVADIVSSDVPETFPTTGDGIVGMGKQYELLPGSTIYVVNNAELYMMNEEREWVKQ